MLGSTATTAPTQVVLGICKSSDVVNGAFLADVNIAFVD